MRLLENVLQTIIILPELPPIHFRNDISRLRKTSFYIISKCLNLVLQLPENLKKVTAEASSVNRSFELFIL